MPDESKIQRGRAVPKASSLHATIIARRGLLCQAAPCVFSAPHGAGETPPFYSCNAHGRRNRLRMRFDCRASDGLTAAAKNFAPLQGSSFPMMFFAWGAAANFYEGKANARKAQANLRRTAVASMPFGSALREQCAHTPARPPQQRTLLPSRLILPHDVFRIGRGGELL